MYINIEDGGCIKQERASKRKCKDDEKEQLKWNEYSSNTAH